MSSRSTTQRPTEPWLRHIGLINDYVRIPYANGSSFASQFLYREFRARGQQVTVLGPKDPDALEEELPQSHVSLPSLPLRNHPGVYLPLPTRQSLAEVAARRFDLMLAQASSELLDLGVYMRATQHIPFLCVNTIHIPSTYNVLLPDALLNNDFAHRLFRDRIVPWAERTTAGVYNQTDGVVVLSGGLKQYWRDLGVTVPIHVIPRSVDPGIFDRPAGEDPFDPRAKKGGRLLCVCRHTREKDVARLLETFARHIYSQMPDTTLTLVGDGPDHDSFKALAAKLGVADRTFFPGEFGLLDVPNFYRHGDIFVYQSLSETYGQVVSEAAWCGLPVVAFADNKGISQQVQDGITGLLIDPGPDYKKANAEFGHHTLELLQNRVYRHTLAERAQRVTRDRAHPEQCIARYYEAFENGREHCRATKAARITQTMAPYTCLARWAAVQTALAGLGCLRAPATLNRHGRRPPGWDATPASILTEHGSKRPLQLTPTAIA